MTDADEIAILRDHVDILYEENKALKRRVAFLEMNQCNTEATIEKYNLTQRMKEAKIAKVIELERQKKERLEMIVEK